MFSEPSSPVLFRVNEQEILPPAKDLFPNKDDLFLPPFSRDAVSVTPGSKSAAKWEFREFSVNLPCLFQDEILQKYSEEILLIIVKYEKYFPETFDVGKFKKGISLLAHPYNMVRHLEYAIKPRNICNIYDKESLSEVYSCVEECKARALNDPEDPSEGQILFEEEFYKETTSSNVVWVCMMPRACEQFSSWLPSNRTFMLFLEENEGEVVMGDLHGNIEDTIGWLLTQGFNSDGTLRRIIVLGDMVDRGNYGIGVLFFFAILKVLYPDKIFLLSGNHEAELVKILRNFAVKQTSVWFEKFVSPFDKEVINALAGYPDCLTRLANVIEKLPLAMFSRDGTMYVHGNIAWPYDKMLVEPPIKPSIGMFVFSVDKAGDYHVLWSELAGKKNQPPGSKSRGSGAGFLNGPEVYSSAFNCGISRLRCGHTHLSYVAWILLTNGQRFSLVSLVSSLRCSKNARSSCALKEKGKTNIFFKALISSESALPLSTPVTSLAASSSGFFTSSTTTSTASPPTNPQLGMN